MVRRVCLAVPVIVSAPLLAMVTSACTGDDDASVSPHDASIDDAALDAAVDSGADAMGDGSDAPTGDAQEVVPLRMASLNLHCLKTTSSAYTTNTARFEAIAQTIASENIAAVAVQEACIAKGVDALEQLRVAVSKSTGEPWSKQWMLAHVGWEGTPDEAQEGVGILARGDLTGVRQVEFKHQSSLTRVMIGATLPTGVRLWSVHLEFNDPLAQVQQAREAAAVALAEADPSWDVIVGGDFNAVKGAPALIAFESMGFLELTASLGSNLIDHVFVHRGAALSVGQSRTLFDGSAQPKVSDHPGVMVTVSPAAGQQVLRTRFIAQGVGQGTWLALRGSGAPLDWSWGWPAWQRADGSWLVVVSELPAGASVAYKWLSGDTGWQSGDDSNCLAGTDCGLSPVF